MAQPEHLVSQRGRRDAPDAEVYELAREEELRRLDGQRAEVDAMRQRTAQYLAFVGAATAFLAGTGIKTPDRDAAFWWLAGSASMLSLAAIFLAVSVFLALALPALRPADWQFVLRPGAVLQMIEADVRAPDAAQLNRHLITLYGSMSVHNEAALAKLRHLYVGFLTVGALQLLVWTALVWARA